MPCSDAGRNCGLLLPMNAAHASIADIASHFHLLFLGNFKKYGHYFVRFRGASAVIVLLLQLSPGLDKTAQAFEQLDVDER